MKRLILLTLITFFSVPNLIYAQDLDFSKISKNTEKAKKENKERIKNQRPTGIIISLGYAGFSDDYSYYSDNIIESIEYGWEGMMETFNLKNGSKIDESESYQSSEINIRLHYLLKNINLGFYISPIVINTTRYEIYRQIETYKEWVITDSWSNDSTFGGSSDFYSENTFEPPEYEEQSGSHLGSIQFGASTTILFNRLTISAGSAFRIAQLSPVKTLEVGVMLHLTEKINVEYKYSTLKTKQEFNGINPKFHMFSVGYRIFKSN